MAASKFTLRTSEESLSVAFSPYSESCSLLAIGGRTQLVVKACTLREVSLQQGSSLLESLTFSDLLNLHVGTEVRHIAWSPASTHNEDEAKLHFCTAGSGHKIRVYLSDSHDTHCQLLEGHSSYINGLAWHPADADILASVGDDKLCHLWSLDSGQPRVTFRLNSPGASVCWHQHDPMKLLVAERGGRVRLYDITTDTPILTLDTPSPPLMDAHWAPTNSLRVGGVANGNWCLWDVSQSSLPLALKSAHSGVATRFRWCGQSDQVFATVGHGNQIKVHHTGHEKVPISCELAAANDVSWHSRLPIVAVAGDNGVNLWSVET